MGRNGNRAANKLRAIQSSGWFEVKHKLDVLSRNGSSGRGQYVVSFPMPMGGGQPVQLVGNDLCGYVQRAFAAAGISSMIDSHQTSDGSLEIIVKREKRGIRVATVALYGSPQERGDSTMGRVSVIPTAGQVGPYSVITLIRAWGAQLSPRDSALDDIFARYTPPAQPVAAKN